MTKILYLPHRIPFPPNKGDKLRSFNFLKHLSQNHEVVLGTFLDDLNDRQYVDTLKQFCCESFVVEQSPLFRRAISLKGIAQRKSLSVPYYESARLQSWVHHVIGRMGIKKLLIFSSTMSQFIDHPQYSHALRIADFCDIDSDKWLQYSQRSKWPMSAVLRREAKYLFAYERAIANRFDFTTFVSEKEAQLFQLLAPETSSKIKFIDMGVDTDYFDPDCESISSIDSEQIGEKAVVFTGAMDYRANSDAVEWFCANVWPKVIFDEPKAKFFVVGSNPPASLTALSGSANVTVTGRVPDVRPFIKFARVAVAPLRIARGTQSKVLEALAMGKQPIVSSSAAQGLDPVALNQLHIVDDPEPMAAKIVQSLNQQRFYESAREAVKISYGWSAHLAKLDQLLRSKKL